MANDPNTIQYVIQEDGFWYVASKDRTPGVPEITVSAKGVANGLSTEYNDGADFGPDSYDPTSTASIPYTKTSGIQEAINYLQLALYIGGAGITYQGHTGSIMLNNGVYKCQTNIVLDVGTNIHIMGESPPQPFPYFGKSFDDLSSIDEYTGGVTWYFPSTVSLPVFTVSTYSSNKNTSCQVFIENVEIRIQNPTSYTDSIAVNMNGFNQGKLKNFFVFSSGAVGSTNNPYGTGNIDTGLSLITNGGTLREFDNVRVAGFYNNGITFNGLTTPLNNSLFKSISVAFVQSVDSGTAAYNFTGGIPSIFMYIHVFNCNIGMQYNQGSNYINQIILLAYFEATPNLLNATMQSTTNLSRLKFIGLQFDDASYFTGDIANSQKVEIMGDIQIANTPSTPIPKAAGSPVLEANPPVSGTVYQNQNPYAITLFVPCYATTSGTSGTMELSMSTSTSPGTKLTQYISGSTSSSAPYTLQFTVQPGWYYKLTASSVTIGTAQAISF